jgi:hypothetical protein
VYRDNEPVGVKKHEEKTRNAKAFGNADERYWRV